MTRKSAHKTVLAALGAFLFLAFWMILAQACRNRSFWLDEAFVAWRYMVRKPAAILFGGSLDVTPPVHVQFPKVYLALIGVIYQWVGKSTFWPRVLPLLFGVSGFAIWMLLFYEYYWLKRKAWIPCLVAGGLLVANSWAPYYAFELKPYSADFFFSGIIFWLFQTQRLDDRRRLIALGTTGVVSLLFSYTSVFVLAAIALAMMVNQTERGLCWAYRRLLGIFTGVGLGLACFLYEIDYRFGMHDSAGTWMRSDWLRYFVQGNSLIGKMVSLLGLYGRFLLAWWTTNSGPMNESFVAPGAWYIVPFCPLYHLVVLFIICVLGFWAVLTGLGDGFAQKAHRNPLVPAAWLTILMVLLASFSIYPWGFNRATLYAMPVAILLIVEGLERFSNLLSRSRATFILGRLIWIPIAWQILRNCLFLGAAFATAPFPQDIRVALAAMDPAKSRTLVVAWGDSVSVCVCPQVPQGVSVYYETGSGVDDFKKKIAGHKFYYLWAQYRPKLIAGVPVNYAGAYQLDEAFVRPPQLQLGLLLLKPRFLPIPA